MTPVTVGLFAGLWLTPRKFKMDEKAGKARVRETALSCVKTHKEKTDTTVSLHTL